jgi:hypothetical protein
MEPRQLLVQVRRIGVSLALSSAAVWACGGSESEGNTVSYGGANSTGTPGGTGPGGGGPVGGVGGVSVGGNAGNISFDAAAGGSGSLEDASCASEKIEAKLTPLDMFIMLDKSGSMVLFGDRWGPVTNAIRTFVQSQEMAGVGVGIGYFGFHPGGPPADLTAPGSCNATDYATPAVPMGVLPMVAQPIIDSLAANAPGGGTPTHPALQGAMQYATQWAVQNPTHKVVVVLATDGEPQGCTGNDIGTVSQVAQAGAAANPQINTYVIGVGNVQGLNQVAQAGGTNQAFIVQDANANQQFLQAMRQIRGQALGCQFNIPKPMGMLPDFTKVNVEHTPTSGGAGIIYHVESAADCRADTGGWYYEKDASGTPTAIKACPQSCQKLVDGGGRVDIAVGCTSITPPA